MQNEIAPKLRPPLGHSQGLNLYKIPLTERVVLMNEIVHIIIISISKEYLLKCYQNH